MGSERAWWRPNRTEKHDPAHVRRSGARAVLASAGREVLLPALFYFLCFVALTYPLITRFSSYFFADTHDGLQNVWNLWWVNTAVTKLHQLPWQTKYLHYPYGVSLLGHTLNPFNGFISIPLLRVLSLTQTYNAVILFSFIVAGMTTFLLAHHLTRAYFPSLVAGFIFTFSSFHVAHARGHLQIVSLEWIPLFLLFWYRLVQERRPVFAIASALTLFLVALCDYYYFLYCAIAGAVFLGWHVIRGIRASTFAWKASLPSLALFAVVISILTGPLVVSLLTLNHSDPLLGSHAPQVFSADLLAPLIPGRTWRFGSLTSGYWSQLPSRVEGNVSVGVAVIGAALYGWKKRKDLGVPGIGVWYLLALAFTALALGPTLEISGRLINLPFPLPYTILGTVLPVLSLSGVPARMMVMTSLSGAVIAAAVLALLLRNGRRGTLWAIAFLAVLLVEYLPAPFHSTRMAVPPYIQAIQRSAPGAIVDLRDPPSTSLYLQTLFERPMAFGYIARIPTSTFYRDTELMQWTREMRADVLYHRYHLRYLIVPPGTGNVFDARIYHGPQADVFDLARAAPGVLIEDVQPKAQVPVGEVLPDFRIGQTFTARHDGLRGFGLLLSSNPKTARGSVTVHLGEQGSNRDLHRWTLSANLVVNDVLHVFSFPPLGVSGGQRYFIHIDGPQETAGHSVSAWGSVGNAYPQGMLKVNGRPSQGDLVLALYYGAHSS